MKELLDVSKVEVEAAQWFMDEELQQFVSIDSSVSKTMFTRFMAIHSFIGQVQTDIKWKCLFIGWALKEMLDSRLYNYVKKKETYSMTGYSSFYKFVRDVYGIKERTAKRMVAVAREFCSASETAGLSEEAVAKLPVCQLKLEYINYSYSQLAELLSISEEYRPRIPVSASVRDIQKVGKLYAGGYVPKRGDTYKDDLEVYKALKKAEQEKKNGNRNRLTFVPAVSVPTSAPTKELFEDEDERDVITPTEGRKIPLSSIKAGFAAQLELLKKNYPEWVSFIVNVTYALEEEKPDELITRNASKLAAGKAATGKLSLKNGTERKEWLENYKTWGVWLDVPQVSKRYYRYNFVNGAAVIVEENLEFYNYVKPHLRTFNRYCIIDEECPEFAEGKVGGLSGVIEWMTKHAKEI